MCADLSVAAFILARRKQTDRCTPCFAERSGALANSPAMPAAGHGHFVSSRRYAIMRAQIMPAQCTSP